MKKLLFTLSMMATVSLSAGYEKGELLYLNEFDSKDALDGIGANSFASAEGMSKDGAFRINGYHGANFIIFKLDAAKLKGLVLMEAVVKGVDISKAEKPYWGSKVMMVIKRKNGTEKYAEPTTLPRSGSFDWTTVTLLEAIPDDVDSVTMMIGLQNTSGQFYIDSLKIFRGIKK